MLFLSLTHGINIWHIPRKNTCYCVRQTKGWKIIVSYVLGIFQSYERSSQVAQDKLKFTKDSEKKDKLKFMLMVGRIQTSEHYGANISFLR